MMHICACVEIRRQAQPATNMAEGRSIRDFARSRRKSQCPLAAKKASEAISPRPDSQTEASEPPSKRRRGECGGRQLTLFEVLGKRPSASPTKPSSLKHKTPEPASSPRHPKAVESPVDVKYRHERSEPVSRGRMLVELARQRAQPLGSKTSQPAASLSAVCDADRRMTSRRRLFDQYGSFVKSEEVEPPRVQQGSEVKNLN